MTRAEIALAASVLKPAAEWVRGQIRRDRENRYSLLRDWTLPAVRCSFWPDAVTGWQTPLFRISKLDRGVVSITIKAYQSTAEENICDGATLSPDRLPGILPAALFHDPWYCRLPHDAAKQYELLADALGVPRKRLRSFGDNLFYAIARAGGCPWLVARLYHAGIRLGYPIVKPFIAAFLAAFLAAGCAGCLVGPDGTFVDPGDYQPPEWEQVSPQSTPCGEARRVRPVLHRNLEAIGETGASRLHRERHAVAQGARRRDGARDPNADVAHADGARRRSLQPRGADVPAPSEGALAVRDWRDLLAILGAAAALLLAVAGFLALVRLAPADYI